MYLDDQLFKVLLKYDFDLNRNEFDVPSYLERHLNQYADDIEIAALGNNPLLGTDFCTEVVKKLPKIKVISKKIVEIGRINRDGKIKDAFELAYSLFSSLEPYYLFRWDVSDYDFYRIRQGDLRIKPGDDKKNKKAELFHIKDGNRHLIGAYRFSIPGFPCLYLTSDFELGWFESGMPKQFSYCRMHIEVRGENAMRLIDISNRPVDLLSSMHVWILNARSNLDELHKIYNYFLNYIIIYPLAAACSIKVKNRNNKFVEEYVIPQMLMNWVRENNKFDGIRYKSSLNTTLVQGMSAINIALPVKKFRADGLCENLTSKILVSDIGYFDVNEEFKKYKQLLQDVTAFKNNIWNKHNNNKYFADYVIQLIDICESVIVTYNSIIDGNQINDVILHQISCMADYIRIIEETKDSIANINVNKVKQMEPSVDETELRMEILSDINQFYTLLTEVIHKYNVFLFAKEEVSGYDKI